MARYQPGPTPRVFESSVVYDRQGRLLAEFFDEGRRRWVPLDSISPNLVDAVIATEDAGFYGNEGVEWRRLLGSAGAQHHDRRHAIGRQHHHDAARPQPLPAA